MKPVMMSASAGWRRSAIAASPSVADMWWGSYPRGVFLTAILLAICGVEQTGSIRRSDDAITADYDLIDRSSPPLFVNNTRDRVVVAQGKDARMECRVANLGDRAVSWIRKSDLHILTMGELVYVNDGRFSVERSGRREVGDDKTNQSAAIDRQPESDLDWTLTLKNADVADSGVYECQINTEPKRSKAFHLQVVVSTAEIVGGDRDVFVHVDSDISLVCKTVSSPTPPEAVAWLKDGTKIDQLLHRGGISVVTDSRRRSSRLLVSKVTKADAGNYTCSPTNAKIDSVNVHVIQGADPRANVMASSSVDLAATNSTILVILSVTSLLRWPRRRRPNFPFN